MKDGRRKAEDGRRQERQKKTEDRQEKWKEEGRRAKKKEGITGRNDSCHCGAGMEKPWDLRERTILFAVSVIRFCRSLPTTRESAEIAGQLRRSSSSLGAQYCAATRNKSDDDYISKLGGAIEEADEAMFWFDILSRTGVASEAVVGPLRAEANELIAILIASRTTAVERRARAKNKPR